MTPHESSLARRRSVQAMLAAVLATVTSLVLAAPAAAHAELESSDPVAGSIIAAAPARVTLTFDDPIDLEGSTVWVYDDTGKRVDTGPLTAAADHPGSVGVDLVAGLGDGTFTVSYTVTSDDTHPVSGTFRYSVQVATSVTDVAPVAQRNDAAGLLLGVMRWVGFVGLVLGPGLLLVLLLIWPGGLRDRRARRLASWGLGLLVLSTLGGMVLEGVWASGASFSALWQDPSSLDTHSRKFDTVFAVRAYLVLALVAVLALALRRSRDPGARPSRTLIVAAGVSTVALVATWPLVSHSAVDAVPLLASVVNLLHSLAMAVWLGGLVVIVACVASPGRLRDDERDAALVAFSRVALVAVGTLLATGVFMTWREVGSVTGLLSTEFGRVLLAKLSSVAVLLLLGNVSRLWVARRGSAGGAVEEPADGGSARGDLLVLTAPAQAATGFRRNVALEVVVAAVVLAITAALVVIGPGQ